MNIFAFWGTFLGLLSIAFMFLETNHTPELGGFHSLITAFLASILIGVAMRSE